MAVDTLTTTKLPLLPSFAWLTGYGELLRSLLRRELRARYKGSALGLLWSLLYPLVMMGVYTLVFSVLWKGARNIPHYPLFVLAGLAVWTFFIVSVQLGSGSLVSAADLIKKVWFPRELVVAAVVLAQTVSAGVILVILIPFTINGLAAREAFFVSFLGQLHVPADAAFATGFLFFLVTLLLSSPGVLIIAWEALHGARRPWQQSPSS